ncbi:MAG: hypothetical protein AAB663_00175 [Patescibacteria group bacterium]
MRPLITSLAVVAVSVLIPSTASAMGTQFDVRPDPLAPFTVIDQTSIMRPAERMLLVTFPNGGNVLTPDVRASVTWESTSSAGFVNIEYSTDNGATYTTIAQGVTDLGSYSWRVPSMYSAQAFVRVTQTDLVDTFASDRSDSEFVINGAKPTAVSPVTGECEEVSPVAPGDFILAPSFPTVYGIDAGGNRRPFETEEILNTYDGAKRILPVTDATLTTLPLGAPLVPKPGVVLVRFAPSSTVYAVEGSAEYPILRAIAREEIAVSRYGDDWKSQVMTLPERYRNFYHGGSVIYTME